MLSAGEWQRMKGQLNSWEEDKVSRIQARRLALHEHSKEIVKNWGNTIEGQRLKRLQAHQIREDGEEVSVGCKGGIGADWCVLMLAEREDGN